MLGIFMYLLVTTFTLTWCCILGRFIV